MNGASEVNGGLERNWEERRKLTRCKITTMMMMTIKEGHGLTENCSSLDSQGL